MAVLYAANSGVAIDSNNMWATTNGGALFVSWADIKTNGTYTLAANGKTAININDSFTCTRISTAVETGSTTGGGFTVSGSSAIVITGNVQGGSTPCVVCTHTGTGANGFTVVNITAGTSVNASGVNNTSSGTINCTNSTGGSNTARGIVNSSTGAVNIAGLCKGGTAAASAGLYCSGSGAVDVLNVTGGSNGTSYGIDNEYTAVITCTGLVLGGTGVGIYNTGGGSIVANNVTGAAGIGINNTGTGGNVTITGTVTAGTAGSGMSNSHTTIYPVLSGNIIMVSGSVFPISGRFIYNPGVNNYMEILKPTSGTYKYGKTIPASSVISGVNGDGADAPAVGTYSAGASGGGHVIGSSIIRRMD